MCVYLKAHNVYTCVRLGSNLSIFALSMYILCVHVCISVVVDNNCCINVHTMGTRVHLSRNWTIVAVSIYIMCVCVYNMQCVCVCVLRGKSLFMTR